MKTRIGTFIVIDGTDASGKKTQAELLVARLVQEGVSAQYFTFPRYESLTGKLIRAALEGQFGDFKTVSPKAASLLFAADRHEAAPNIITALEAGITVVCDRYVTANLAHQGSKIPVDQPAERKAFLEWILALEYGHLGLPKPDHTLILKVPVEISLELLQERSRTNGQALDGHESSATHLRAAFDMFTMIGECIPGITSINCAPSGLTRADLLSRETIHELVWAEAQKVVPQTVISQR